MRNPNTQGNRGICFLVLSCAGPPGIRAGPSRRTTFVGLSKQNGRTTKNAQLPERGVQIDAQRKFQIVQAKRTGCANCVFPFASLYLHFKRFFPNNIYKFLNVTNIINNLIKESQESITPSPSGGGGGADSLKKYLKYKQKYIQLKNKLKIN